jgi:hypothetical protein
VGGAVIVDEAVFRGQPDGVDHERIPVGTTCNCDVTRLKGSQVAVWPCASVAVAL